jgi:hypothetical protein
VGSDDRKYSVLFEEVFAEFCAEEVGASSHIVAFDEAVALTGFRVDGVSPNEVTEESCFGYLSEAIDAFDIFELRLQGVTDRS